MTQHQKELVKTSFAKILPVSQEAANLFYSRLFEIAPYIRPLFKGDINEQGKKLMQTLHVAVNSLDRLEEIIPTLKKMGRDYRSYGVTNAHYDIVASALLWTLERVFGPEFTDEVRNAWVAMYTMVADVMKKGAEELHQAA